MNTIMLPPDPDGQNGDRAGWAQKALAAFKEETHCDDEDTLCDLLCDLMHQCDRDGVSFDEQLDRARSHYKVEIDPEAWR